MNGSLGPVGLCNLRQLDTSNGCQDHRHPNPRAMVERIKREMARVKRTGKS
jgi:hypothetical protein